jgi:WD40 repeat protein
MTFKGHNESVKSVDISNDDNYIISGSSDKTIKLWKVNNGECVKTF